MSSINIINWSPDVLTPTLNNGDLSSLKASRASDNYYPYTTLIPRNPDKLSAKGVWGKSNSFIVTTDGSGETQIYNNLSDPKEAAFNIDLMLWIFPGFLIFSQLENQLGAPIYPN